MGFYQSTTELRLVVPPLPLPRLFFFILHNNVYVCVCSSCKLINMFHFYHLNEQGMKKEYDKKRTAYINAKLKTSKEKAAKKTSAVKVNEVTH